MTNGGKERYGVKGQVRGIKKGIKKEGKRKADDSSKEDTVEKVARFKTVLPSLATAKVNFRGKAFSRGILAKMSTFRANHDRVRC